MPLSHAIRRRARRAVTSSLLALPSLAVPLVSVQQPGKGELCRGDSRFRSKGRRDRVASRFAAIHGSTRAPLAGKSAARSKRWSNGEMVREERLDLALATLVGYHLWLLYAILRHPAKTVIGLNAIARKRWVAAMIAVAFVSREQNTEKNGVLAVQTLRNNIMASTVLATTAITLVSVISVFVGVTSPASSSSSSPPSRAAPRLVYGSKAGEVFATKYLAVSLCFMLAFVCNVQAIRLYAHASFLLGGLPPGDCTPEEFAAYVARTVNRGSYAWSLGLRAFYVSLALFLWTFGPIPMLVCSVLMCGLLYFLDTTSDHGHGHHRGSAGKDISAV
ncbi:uncharacterized protein C2845_PM07G19090 [Panicum miliaceum]|uniref:DUF599 domain-containing protein n=1 Tax=Panicum miliaceum TaxID=4540 RepID=A0A3L6SND3_PANMI|nr:uncharacterized protein C2845_PM07G19090 [Panicum miliaceum]